MNAGLFQLSLPWAVSYPPVPARRLSAGPKVLSVHLAQMQGAGRYHQMQPGPGHSSCQSEPNNWSPTKGEQDTATEGREKRPLPELPDRDVGGLGVTRKPDRGLLPISVSEPLHTSLRRWERLRRELTMTAWATLLGITIVQNRWFSALCAGPPGKDTDTAAGAAGSRPSSCAQSTTLCRYIMDDFGCRAETEDGAEAGA